MAMPPYTLARHVFACLDRQHVVLLDLKQDRYFAFETAKAPGLDTVVSGWPATSPGEVASAGDRGRIVRRLIERKLLCGNGAITGEVTRVAVPAPCVELFCDQYGDFPPRRLENVAAFLCSATLATIMLRCRSLRQTVRRIENRGARRRHAAPFDISRARELVAAFTDLRPFLFSSRDACLFESLVLIEFLARYRLYPLWVFGVQARPFAAHCWVQQGAVVLNDTLEHVSRYTPIMAA